MAITKNMKRFSSGLVPVDEIGALRKVDFIPLDTRKPEYRHLATVRNGYVCLTSAVQPELEYISS